METIITIATVLSMYLGSVQSNNVNYCYNADIENGIVKNMYVYDTSSESIANKLRYEFSYDDEGRLTEKQAFKWNALLREYRPYYRLQFNYTCAGYEVTCSKWNKADNDWSEAMEKSVYTFEMDNLVSVNHMRRSSERREFRTVDSVLMLNPTNDIILAEAFH